MAGHSQEAPSFLVRQLCPEAAVRQCSGCFLSVDSENRPRNEDAVYQLGRFFLGEGARVQASLPPDTVRCRVSLRLLCP